METCSDLSHSTAFSSHWAQTSPLSVDSSVLRSLPAAPPSPSFRASPLPVGACAASVPCDSSAMVDEERERRLRQCAALVGNDAHLRCLGALCEAAVTSLVTGASPQPPLLCRLKTLLDQEGRMEVGHFHAALAFYLRAIAKQTYRETLEKIKPFNATVASEESCLRKFVASQVSSTLLRLLRDPSTEPTRLFSSLDQKTAGSMKVLESTILKLCEQEFPLEVAASLDPEINSDEAANYRAWLKQAIFMAFLALHIEMHVSQRFDWYSRTTVRATCFDKGPEKLAQKIRRETTAMQRLCLAEVRSLLSNCIDNPSLEKTYGVLAFCPQLAETMTLKSLRQKFSYLLPRGDLNPARLGSMSLSDEKISEEVKQVRDACLAPHCPFQGTQRLLPKNES